MGKPRTYEGASIAVSFDMARCIHARNCFLKLPQVFDPSRRPWVDPDAAPADEIASLQSSSTGPGLTYSMARLLNSDAGIKEAARIGKANPAHPAFYRAVTALRR